MKITVSTVVAAPITDVWRAYNSPDDIKIWNTASSDWHTTSSSVDLRVGGQVLISHGGEGRLLWFRL